MSRLLVAQRALTVPGWAKDALWRRAQAIPSLDLRFADSKSLVDATTGSNLVTFTRASSGTFVGSDGVLQTAVTDAPRFDHNPTTGESLGLLVEEQRTNSIRNNTMVGAVAGTPGTLSTNWAISGLGTLTQQVVGVGTAAGISYIDIRLSGTTSNTSLSIRLDGNTGIAATNGQTFTHSFWSAVVGGSTSGVALGTNANLYDSGGVFVGGLGFTGATVNTASTLLRTSGTGTIATANTAFIQSQLFATYANGAAIDITIRIGLPQLEQGAFATSVIPTSTVAVTRSADVASISGSNFSAWYRQDEGTLYGDAFRPFAVPGPDFPIIADTRTGTDRFQIGYLTEGLASAYVQVGGAGQAELYPGSGNARNRKVAFAAAANSYAAVCNGGTVATDVSGLMPASMTSLSIGSMGSAQFLNGTIRRLVFWGQRLPNNILQSITQ